MLAPKLCYTWGLKLAAILVIQVFDPEETYVPLLFC